MGNKTSRAAKAATPVKPGPPDRMHSTGNYADITQHKNNATNKQNELTNIASNLTNRLLEVRNFLPVQWANEASSYISSHETMSSSYVYDESTYIGYTQGGCSARHHHTSRRARRRRHYHHCVSWFQDPLPPVYYYNLDNNWFPTVNARIQDMEAKKNLIPELIYNNEENGRCLVNEAGIERFGINKKLEDMRITLKPIKDMSNYVMSLINHEQIHKHPQYNIAKQFDDQINAAYAYNPMDRRSNFNSGYSADQYHKILNKISHNKSYFPKNYMNCKNINSHVGVDQAGVPYCIDKEYINTAKKCSEAIKLSQVYEYGTKDLNKLWFDIQNSTPGNLQQQSKKILNIGSDSCKKWVDMFNIWEQKEAEALAQPCLPERPVVNENDKIIIAMIEEWNSSASSHIQQLKQRLLDIQKYIQNYPNILELNKNDITLAPSSLPGTSIIKIDMENKKPGIAPMQKFELIIPNGKPGETGDRGKTGIFGDIGKRGEKGEEGPIGNANIPKFY